MLRVELDPFGKAHCAWCDTRIARGSPRVARRCFHAECDYSRDNGAATGHNPGGWQDEYMHAQCAFQYDSNPRGRPAMCAGGCGQRVSPPRRLLTRFGKPGARCTVASAPLYYCFPCATAFTQRHRQLLVGHLGVRQAESKVAWVSAGLFAPADGSSGGPPPLPKDRALRQAYVDCFRFDPPQSAEEEQRSCLSHAALQCIIGAALQKDRALMRSSKAEAPAANASRNSKAPGASGVSGTSKRPRDEGLPAPEAVANLAKAGKVPKADSPAP